MWVARFLPEMLFDVLTMGVSMRSRRPLSLNPFGVEEEQSLVSK